MSPRTCSTCKHWWPTQDLSTESYAHAVAVPTDPDTCEPMVMPYEVRICRSPKLLWHERPVEPSQAALVDGSEYYAALLTGPDFGCVNHEPANQEPPK